MYIPFAPEECSHLRTHVKLFTNMRYYRGCPLFFVTCSNVHIDGVHESTAAPVSSAASAEALCAYLVNTRVHWLGNQ